MNIIKANEVVQYQFYAVPQAFFTEEKYKKTLSLEAKMVYSFLLDRLSLSQRNYWYDEENNVFLIYKRKDISDILELSEKTTIKAFKELKSVDLLYEKRQGLGKPNLIYLGKVILDNQEKTISQFKNCKNYNSVVENNTGQNMENLQFINNTNINNLNKNNTEKSQSVELKKIKEQCELDILVEEDEFGNINKRKMEMVENAIEMMYYSESIKVDSAIIPQDLVRNKLKQLNGAKICYALQKLNTSLGNTQNVTNSTKFLISCIYNAISEYYSDAEIQYKIDCLN